MLECSFHDFLFRFETKFLKIIVFSKLDGLKMNGSTIGLGKKNDTVATCNYCSKDVSVANMEDAALMSLMKGKKVCRKVSF